MKRLPIRKRYVAITVFLLLLLSLLTVFLLREPRNPPVYDDVSFWFMLEDHGGVGLPLNPSQKRYIPWLLKWGIFVEERRHTDTTKVNVPGEVYDLELTWEFLGSSEGIDRYEISATAIHTPKFPAPKKTSELLVNEEISVMGSKFEIYSDDEYTLAIGHRNDDANPGW